MGEITTMKLITAIAALLMLVLVGGCAHTGGCPRLGRADTDAFARGVDFRGMGQEPGWVVEIDVDRSITYIGDYGMRRVEVPYQAPVDVLGRRTYTVNDGRHQLSVVIESRPCTDIMSGEAFPNTVTVILDGVSHQGCGRWLR